MRRFARRLAAFGWLDGAALAGLVLLYWAILAPLQRARGVCADDVWLGQIAGRTLEWLSVLGSSMQLPLSSLPAVFGWHGPWSAYVTMPFISLFGRTERALLISARFFGAALILTTYAAGRALYDDRRAALCAAVPAAVSPFAYFLPLAAGYAGLREIVFGMAAFVFAISAARNAGLWAAAAAGLSAGIALGSHWTMVAWAAGLLACVASTLGPQAGWRRTGRLLAVSAASLLVPLLPMAVAHGVAKQVSSAFVQHLVIRGDGSSNADFADSLVTRARQLLKLPNADLEKEKERWRGGVKSQWYAACFLFLAAAGAAAAWWMGGRRRFLSWPWLLGGAYFLLSVLSPSILRQAHLAPLFPLLALMAAAPLTLMPARARVAPMAAFGALLVAGLLATAQEWPRLVTPGGSSFGNGMQEGAFEICDWLAAHPEARLFLLLDRVYFLDYCAPEPVRRGRVTNGLPLEASGPAFDGLMSVLARQPNLVLGLDLESEDDGELSAIRAWLHHAGLGLRCARPVRQGRWCLATISRKPRPLLAREARLVSEASACREADRACQSARWVKAIGSSSLDAPWVMSSRERQSFFALARRGLSPSQELAMARALEPLLRLRPEAWLEEARAHLAAGRQAEALAAINQALDLSADELERRETERVRLEFMRRRPRP